MNPLVVSAIASIIVFVGSVAIVAIIIREISGGDDNKKGDE